MCKHPEHHKMYEQLNKYESTPIENLIGFPSNYFVWRVVYCGDCKTILERIGPVPDRYK